MISEDISKDKHKKVIGVSCLSRYKQTSKLIKGYSQPNSMSRALGFEHPYNGQSSLGGYNHLINFSDVENVAAWLFDNGYDIVKLKK